MTSRQAAGRSHRWRGRLASLIAASTMVTVPQADAAPGTFRLDFYFTGGPQEEIYSLDRVVAEPLPWPGPPPARLDPSDYGVYRVEIEDSAGHVTFRRGFSPLFWEWTTTAEARDRTRTFHESVRFPEPAEPVTVVFSKRDERGNFEEVWRVAVDPADPYVDRAVPPRLEVLELERHGEPTNKVDLLLLGDGYTSDECASKFRADAERMRTALFRLDPFRERRDDFNVWGLCPPSPESGISRPSTGIHRASPVGTTYDIFGAERYVLTYDNRSLRNIAARAPHDYIVILANAETYGGGGLYNVYATVTVDNDFADYLFVHEFAHHFAALADEYYTSPLVYEPPEEIFEPWEPNVTTLPNATALKWRDLLTPGVPLPTPWPKEAYEEYMRDVQARRIAIREQELPEEAMSALFREEQQASSRMLGSAEFAGAVGAFQGANYDAEAYFRPQIDCVMFTRNEVPFCRVCERVLSKVIDFYTSLPSD